MEIITTRYESLLKALVTLEESIKLLQIYTTEPHPQLYRPLRDSCIQRFEYSFDGFWKFIKLYLEKYEKIDVESASPRIVLRTACNINIFSSHNIEILLNALSDRNLTSHSYNELLAEQIVSRIPLYYQTMHAIVIKIKI